MKRIGILCFLLAAFLYGCDNKKMIVTGKDLRAGFADPSGTARPKVYYWWLNGYTDTTVIKEELHSIKAAGIGGVDIFEIGFKPEGGMPPGPAFMGDTSLQHIVFAIKEAGKLGLEVGLNLASSWNAGGSWVKPVHAAKSLYQTKTKVNRAGPQQISLAYPSLPMKDKNGKPSAIVWKDNGKPVYSKEIAVLAIPKQRQATDTSEIQNLTAFLNADTDILSWDVPAGEWEIHRYVCAGSGEKLLMPSPYSAGPIIDHFDSAATRAHFEYFINRLQPEIGDFRKSALKNFYLASFEAKATVWSGLMGEEFAAMHGYGLEKYLPSVFDSSFFEPTIYKNFNNHLRQTMSEMMIRNHYEKGREICNQYGLQLISESGGPYHHNVPVEALKALGVLDVPRGEFWINQKRYGKTIDSVDLLFLVKQIAAASNIYERKITELEAFTSYQNWMEAPVDMKPVGDRAFAEGMNRPVVHGFTHNPGDFGNPGIAYYAGTHYNNKTTWWPRVKPFNDYLSRISYIFQESQFHADVVFYYGNRVPNYTTPKNSRFFAGSGYDYEIINTEKLITALTVKDGLLTMPYGVTFSVLALGAIDNPSAALINKLKQLADEGAVIVGPQPTNAGKEADGLWQSFGGSFEKGRIYDIPVLTALEQLNIAPDFNFEEKGSTRLDYQKADQPALDFIHYKNGGQDFYFIRNTTDKWLSRHCTFRQQEKGIEIWHPETGDIIPVSIAETVKGLTTLPLSFAPYESYFVAFSAGAALAKYTAVSGDGHPPLIKFSKDGIEWLSSGEYTLAGANPLKVKADNHAETVTGPWQLSFDSSWGAPSRYTMDQLQSWTDVENEGIRYYSGKADYSTDFDFNTREGNHRIYLNLGEVGKVATVWVNGKPAGTSWSLPHQINITSLVQNGKNQLKVEVINTWSNRIIGDKLKGTNYTKTNLDETGYRDLLNTIHIPWEQTPLLPSGLLSPVKIEWVSIK